MRGNLEAGRRSSVGELQYFGIGMELQAAGLGLVGIRLFQPRAARAERAVGVEFDADHPQPVAVHPLRRLRLGVQQLKLVGVDHQPYLQPVGVTRSAHGLPIGERRAHRSHAGDPIAQ